MKNATGDSSDIRLADQQREGNDRKDEMKLRQREILRTNLSK